MSAIAKVPMHVAPYGLSGIVYGTLLNHRSAVAALADVMNQPPYKGAPLAPVLYIKPRNTLTGHGEAVTVPADTAELEVGACLGVVIGRAACRLSPVTAMEAVAGYVIVNDLSVPHQTFYRPSIRFKARDGFCPIGPRVTPRAAIANPDKLNIRVWLDGELRQEVTTADSIRSVAQLLTDVTEFMTLCAGDVLALGVAWPAPRARSGQRVTIEIDGLGRLENRLVGAVS
jgi:5-oxopent-3-ene-1,2,5-tricarboxylate decarboxylase / 2-hydroxyhepta-2,4-diene-1,7-dioate isomerase